MKEFVHLHLHTEYSLLDGACRIDELFDYCKKNAMPAVALTDHGNMFATVQFQMAAKKSGIKPIFGCEMYMCSDMHQKKGKVSGEFDHLVLLAKNEIGYKNLIKLDSLAFVEGFYYKPRIDMNLLRQHSEGLVCLSACLAGGVPRKLVQNDYEGAKQLAQSFIDIFGKDDYYIELQDHGIAEQRMINPQLIKLARELGVKLVATNDVHYISKNDAEMHDVLLCIQTQKTIDDPGRMKFDGDQFYMKNYDEMLEVFPYIEEALENTLEISNKCNFELQFKMELLPNYIPPRGLSPAEYLRELLEEGLKKRYGEITQEIRERADYEYNIIYDMGFVEYYLIVWDFINYARTQNIPVGPGRGSGVGSIVAYAIGITNVEPLKYNLLFERFLNIERISMPDFDVDFCNEGREQVIAYVREKYGNDNVAQIATFGTMKAKGALKDVARVYKMPYTEADKLAKAFPKDTDTRLKYVFGLATDTKKKIFKVPELYESYNDDPNVKKVVDMAIRIENMPRQISMHAAGVVICKYIISDYVPLQKNGNDITTQFTKDEVEKLGLLKMDFLGLKTLTDISRALEYIEETTGEKIDFENIGYDDKGVYELLGTGETDAVFQLESAGMKRFLKDLKPNSFEEIIAGISLYRPGPMNDIPQYISGKNNPKSIKYLTPELEDILNVTYGVIVYQEQVMQIVQKLAGFSLGQADIVRRAMSKKDSSGMKEQRDLFINGKVDDEGKIIIKGALRMGIEKRAAEKIFDAMNDFAKYAFNKSHAAAYAVLAYQTAYLKKYYPMHLVVSVLNNRMNSPDDIIKYVNYATLKGYKVHLPNVNCSKSLFAVTENGILFGLNAIKGVGYSFCENIVATRNGGGNFTSFEDFMSRVDLSIANKRMIEHLIKGGAFDCVNANRTQLLAIYEPIYLRQINENKIKAKGQFSMFEMLGESVQMPLMQAANSVKEASTFEKLFDEKEVLGMYLSGHPLDDFKEKLNTFCNFSTGHIPTLNADSEEDEDINTLIANSNIKNNMPVKMGGIILKPNKIITKQGKEMCFFRLEDLHGSIEIIAFPSIYTQCKGKIIEDAVAKIEGNLLVSDGDPIKVSLTKMELWDVMDETQSVEIKASKEQSKLHAQAENKLCIRLDNDDNLLHIQDILLAYKGQSEVLVQIQKSLKKLPMKVKYCSALKAELLTLLSDQDIKYI